MLIRLDSVDYDSVLSSGLVDLFLLRHGIAVERDEAVDHPERGLMQVRVVTGIGDHANCRHELHAELQIQKGGDFGFKKILLS